MNDTSLGVVNPPIALERRQSPRARLSGSATAIFTGGPGAGQLTNVQLVDACAGGLGVLSPVEVAMGSAFSIMPDAGRFPRLTGIVVRCEKHEGGFRLGLAGKLRVAA